MLQAQTALRRKWAQWKIVWEKNPVHSNFHSSSHYCTSSFTMSDTGQTPISLKPSPPLVAPPPDEPRPLGPPPKELAQTNGQWRDGEAGPQQQKQQTPGISETTRV